LQIIINLQKDSHIMKTLKLLSFIFGLAVVSLVTMSFRSAGTQSVSSALLPDLRVSAIATPGGLCQGNESKVRVSITNSQMIGVKQKIPVILYVSQQGEQPKSYVGYLEGGIGPNANSGQPVWFNNVAIPAVNKNVTLKAVVNPDQEIQESKYNNNTKIINAKVVKACGQAPTAVAGASLEMTVYKDGTWQAGNYQGIHSAQVTVTKSGQTYTGTTNNNGKYTFPAIPKGMVSIKVEKQGYQTVTQSYNMPTYPAKKNIGLVMN
jgi:hypothetical protein